MDEPAAKVKLLAGAITDRGPLCEAPSERRMVGHSGGFPGISSKLELEPATGSVLVVLSNYGDAIFRPLGLRKLLLR